MLQHFTRFCVQVQIYRQLWDNLVKGNFSTSFFLTKLDLATAADQVLSKDVVQHIKSSAVSASSLGELLSQLTTSAQALVCISSTEIEYVLQETSSVIGRLNVEEDSEWLWRMFCHCMDFWHGRRKQEGVDVEEAWKCGRCEFSSLCEWRLRKSSILSANNCCSAREASSLVGTSNHWLIFLQDKFAFFPIVYSRCSLFHQQMKFRQF